MLEELFGVLALLTFSLLVSKQLVPKAYAIKPVSQRWISRVTLHLVVFINDFGEVAERPNAGALKASEV